MKSNIRGSSRSLINIISAIPFNVVSDGFIGYENRFFTIFIEGESEGLLQEYLRNIIGPVHYSNDKIFV